MQNGQSEAACEVVVRPQIGRCLIARRPIAAEEVILVEQPLVACQFSWNRLVGYKACDHCLRPLETVLENVARLAKCPVSVPYVECCVCNASLHRCCDYCSVSYCSASCKEQAWLLYHQLLCPGANKECAAALQSLDDVWRQTHYPPETTTVFLIVRLIAMLRLSTLERRSELLSALFAMCSEEVSEDQTIFHKLLEEQFRGGLQLVADSLAQLSCIADETTRPWLSFAGLKQMLALIGRNGQGIGTSSLSAWRTNVERSGLLNLNSGDETRQKFERFVDQLYDQLDEVSGCEFLDCEGSGLYATQSAANHSCTPNAKIEFLHNDSTLSLVAAAAIDAGQEIFVSYLGECDLERSRHSRQKLLRQNYLFHCNCARCLDELEQPDMTSEEEEDTEEDSSD